MTASGELNVLIVDDHEGMRTLLRAMLERAGVTRVRDAESAAAAFALMAEAAPGLILVDRRMPEMDGLAFIQRVRGDDTYADVRIIMISGEADRPAQNAAIEAGANSVLSKPVAPRALLAEIEKLFA